MNNRPQASEMALAVVNSGPQIHEVTASSGTMNLSDGRYLECLYEGQVRGFKPAPPGLCLFLPAKGPDSQPQEDQTDSQDQQRLL
jgi:hypothetical protein